MNQRTPRFLGPLFESNRGHLVRLMGIVRIPLAEPHVGREGVLSPGWDESAAASDRDQVRPSAAGSGAVVLGDLLSLLNDLDARVALTAAIALADEMQNAQDLLGFALTRALEILDAPRLVPEEEAPGTDISREALGQTYGRRCRGSRLRGVIADRLPGSAPFRNGVTATSAQTLAAHVPAPLPDELIVFLRCADGQDAPTL